MGEKLGPKKIDFKILRMNFKGVSRREPHLRWNFERTGEHCFEDELVKYHFAIVHEDATKRAEVLKKLIEMLNYTGGVEPELRTSGKVKYSDCSYDFYSINSRSATEVIQWHKLGVPKVQDSNLFERRVSRGNVPGIEGYVAEVYER